MTALLLGGFIGAAIEKGRQIFIASGFTQGIFIGTRAFGIMMGVIIGRAWSVTWLTARAPVARMATFGGVLGYALLLVAIAWRGGWQADGALLRVGSLNWLRFFIITTRPSRTRCRACSAMPSCIRRWG